jgi:FtsH-binding integral membrane protein
MFCRLCGKAIATDSVFCTHCGKGIDTNTPSEDMASKKGLSLDLLKYLSQMSVVVLALTYTSGFLIVTTYLDTFGLRDVGTDLFKTRYLQVGVLFMLLPASVFVPIWAHLYLRSRSKETGAGATPQRTRPLKTVNVLLVLNLVLLFSILVAFAPPSYIPAVFWPVIAIAAITVLGISIFGRSELKWVRFRHFFRWGRYGLFVAILILDWLWLYGLHARMLEMFQHSGFRFYVCCIALATFLVWRFTKRASDWQTWRERAAFWIYASSTVGGLYFVAVFAFAHGMYPYVPAVHGGGDLSDASDAVIFFRTSTEFNAPPELLSPKSPESVAPPVICGPLAPPPPRIQAICSRRVKVIVETDVGVFVALSEEAGGPDGWRRGRRPKVYGIPRTQLSSIEYFERPRSTIH